MHHAVQNQAANANNHAFDFHAMLHFLPFRLVGRIDFQFSIVAALRSVGSLTFSRYLT